MLHAHDRAALRAFREVLARWDYTDRNLVARFGEVSIPTARTRNRARLVHLTRSGSPLDTLVRLFLFGFPVAAAAARQAVAPVALEDLHTAGLIAPSGEDVVSTVTLMPYSRFVLAIDQPVKILEGGDPDLVMGITTSTTHLAHATIRRHAREALDLGTGNGLQAFLAAAHSDSVWAVDQAPRAVSFAAFNAVLNGVENVHVGRGDLFEPVEGRQFDLIVGNLPFAITPTRRYVYRDSGQPLDCFARQVVRAAPQYLADGGYCQLECQWVHLAGVDWKDRLSIWFEGIGCDVVVLKLETIPALVYAENWIRDTEPETPGLDEQLFREWADYYAREGVEAVTTGLISLRRRTAGANWVHIEEADSPIPAGAGEFVERLFGLCDFARTHDDAEFLASRFAVAPDVLLRVHNEWSPQGWQAVSSELLQNDGLRFAGNIDGAVATLLARCDGRLTLAAAIAQLAAQLRLPEDRIAPACLPLVRQLLTRGFLVPVTHPPLARHS